MEYLLLLLLILLILLILLTLLLFFICSNVKVDCIRMSEARLFRIRFEPSHFSRQGVFIQKQFPASIRTIRFN
jgi:lipopolysaccharide export LptBFGC system permease protein LptF